MDLGCAAGASICRGDAAADLACDRRRLDAGIHAVAGRSGDRELHHRSRRETLPIRIYSEVRLGVKPEINAVCTMVVGLIAVVIVVASLAAKLSRAQGQSAAPL